MDRRVLRRLEAGCIEVAKDTSYNHRNGDWEYFHPANPEYGNLDWKLMNRVCAGEIIPCYLSVGVSKNGVGLGRSSFGGGMLDDGKAADVFDPGDIESFIEEAQAEATAKLVKLCGVN